MRKTLDVQRFRFHSISFPSEWGLEYRFLRLSDNLLACFHSISFPNEWGLESGSISNQDLRVSIQLVSPTSGDSNVCRQDGDLGCESVSIQLVSPTSGDSTLTELKITNYACDCFHSISFPNEWGREEEKALAQAKEF